MRRKKSEPGDEWGDIPADLERLPDLTDASVVHMILYNHTPLETWSVTGELVEVFCSTCYRLWPCLSVKKAREVAPDWESEIY